MHLLAHLLIPQLVSAAALGARDYGNRAVYFLDNNPAGSSIVSLKISPQDGTLSNPIRTSTGGIGLFGLTASKTGAAPAAGGAGTGQYPFNEAQSDSIRYSLHPRFSGCVARCTNPPENLVLNK